MSLGPQCWRCRKRRLRCDSSLPACRKCCAANIECPGYGEKRPIAWRKPILLTDKGIVRIRVNGVNEKPAAASVMGMMCRSPRTVGSELELRITADAIDYYNLRVAPDLVPYATRKSPYQIPTSVVGELAEYVRKAYISISALHRLVTGGPHTISQFASDGTTAPQSAVRSQAKAELDASDASEISELMAARDFKSVHFASQAAAMRALSEDLQRHQSASHIDDALPDFLLGIMLMLSSQIQYSAYAPWQTHIDGAWGLITAQGGVEVIARQNHDHYRVLQQIAAVDIFGISTDHLTTSSASTILSRHASYASVFDKGSVGILNPWTLMPKSLAKTLNQINMLRAQEVLDPSRWRTEEGLLAVLKSLEKASPESWAVDVATNATVWLAPGLSDDEHTRAAWKALMAAFLNATILYAINSLAGLIGTSNRESFDRDSHPSTSHKDPAAFEALLLSIQFLLDQRVQQQEPNVHPASAATSAGLLHMFVIWPMVVGGIQAALVHRDEKTIAYLCAGMQAIGEELVSMIDGARLVDKLWRSHKNGFELTSWDGLFDGAPLFLM
ncbi:Beauvericin cluster-specific repressor BEA4 [Colletotrichum orbiculare MAFF 240422]|uniref:Beauvericin cluster-specific repressor BEA4 n=1 Tax=Colletotrichum orbiculare (strain 104-T / ATCC 96160 / CBS 514.97 / LARS 414 / MAFF 240422) TaxID=1213857 RepID=A0A484FUK0_COLOR|nr:Beauvericin cluster-specific repressor BEA4 [Colletotrichum orbiculare MAFF 240422]